MGKFVTFRKVAELIFFGTTVAILGFFSVGVRRDTTGTNVTFGVPIVSADAPVAEGCAGESAGGSGESGSGCEGSSSSC